MVERCRRSLNRIGVRRNINRLTITRRRRDDVFQWLRTGRGCVACRGRPRRSIARLTQSEVGVRLLESIRLLRIGGADARRRTVTCFPVSAVLSKIVDDSANAWPTNRNCRRSRIGTSLAAVCCHRALSGTVIVEVRAGTLRCPPTAISRENIHGIIAMLALKASFGRWQSTCVSASAKATRLREGQAHSGRRADLVTRRTRHGVKLQAGRERLRRQAGDSVSFVRT